MIKASKVYTSVYGTLASDFTDKVNYAIYDMARERKSTDSFIVDLKILCDKDGSLKKFVDENLVPSCEIKFFMENEYRYSFTINYIPYHEFDFEVSDEIAKSHADDYEISKDEMYDNNWFDEAISFCDEDSMDYYGGDDYSESLCDYDE